MLVHVGLGGGGEGGGLLGIGVLLGGNRWVSLVDEKKPPGKPGIATYCSTKTTKKDTYGPRDSRVGSWWGGKC